MMIEAMTVAMLCLVQDPEPATGEPENPALVVLRAADEATRDVSNARYDGHWCATGALAGDHSVGKGTVTLSGTGPWSIDGSYYDGSDGSQGSCRLVFDGRQLSVRDDTRKTVTVGQPDMQTGGPAIGVFMIEYVHPTPFQDEINGTQQVLEGRTLVGDVVCDVVFVEYGSVAPGVTARWYFGVEDHLPRRVERLQDADGGPGALVLTVENLEVGFEPADDAFAFEAPDDYERRRQAPSLRLQRGPGN